MKRLVLCTLLAFALLPLAAMAGDDAPQGKGEMKVDSSQQEGKAMQPDSTKKAEWVTTKSGLKYLDSVVGDGPVAEDGDMVSVHYTGWLYVNGERTKKFDSSVDRGKPIEFKLGTGRVIAGWDEGLKGMHVGGKRELIIPPNLGYGSQAMGQVIPANSTLDFEVQLVGIQGK